MKTLSPPLFLTTKEVADLLKINEKLVYGLVRDKGLPATKVTGKWLFPRRLVEEWLDSHVLNFPQSVLAPAEDSGALLIAGSDDPLFQQALALFLARQTDIVPFFANLGSMGGLISLRRGLCHIGVCHLLQDDSREYNFDFALQELERTPVLVNFSQREQGILIRKGNPKGIRSVSDFARKDIRIVNRRLGTGTRLLLDYEIARSALSIADITGYHTEVGRHLDAGIEVLAGRADAAPAIRAVAGLLDLDFIPLRWERFDLLILRDRFFERGIQRFLSLLHEDGFRAAANTFTGYDLSRCGQILYPETIKQEE